MREEHKVVGIRDVPGATEGLSTLWETLARMGHEYYVEVPTSPDQDVKYKNERTLEQRLDDTLNKFLNVEKGLVKRVLEFEKTLEGLGEKKQRRCEMIVTKSLAVGEKNTKQQELDNFIHEFNNVSEIMGKLKRRERELSENAQSQSNKIEAATNRKLELFQSMLKDISDKKVLADVIGKFTRFIHQAHKAEVEMPTTKQVREFVSAVNKDASNVKKLWESCFAIPGKSSEENVVEKSVVKTRLTPRGTAGD